VLLQALHTGECAPQCLFTVPDALLKLLIGGAPEGRITTHACLHYLPHGVRMCMQNKAPGGWARGRQSVIGGMFTIFVLLATSFTKHSQQESSIRPAAYQGCRGPDV
jgi:hypothetical protein